MITRRRLITTGLATAAGASGFVVASRSGLIPPDHNGLYGIGETLTYAAHRLLTVNSLAREFPRSKISKDPIVNGQLPRDNTFQRLLAGNFSTWRLAIDGLVSNPLLISLSELQSYPSTSQITHLACEEGWSFIAEWTGVRLSHVLSLAGILPQAKYVVYASFDPIWWDSIDLPEALHPQTLLTYQMNGEPLPTSHGAPVRLRVPRQLGYKSVKHLTSITVTDNLKSIRTGLGSSAPSFGYSWYAGI